MQPSPENAGPPTGILRAAVVVVLVLTLAAVGLLVMAAMADAGRPNQVGPVPPLFVPAVATLLAGVALAAVIEGLARVVGRPAARPADGAGPGLALAAAELREAAIALQPVPTPTPVEATTAPAVADVVEPVATAADPYLAHFERMVHLLEEIKELTVLDEAGRQARGQQAKERRKHGRLEEADLLIHRQAWEQADALLTLLESLHPGDDHVLTRRSELEDARLAHRDAEWQQLVRHAEDLMALNRYDEAATAVAGFRESYPAHGDAAGLAAMVGSERSAHAEAGVTGAVRRDQDGRRRPPVANGVGRVPAVPGQVPGARQGRADPPASAGRAAERRDRGAARAGGADQGTG